MKIPISLCILFLAGNISLAQIDSRGGVLLRSSRQVDEAKNTYAVIIGISEYQDPQITDLQYAHVDAKAFYQYLRSPDGGSVADKNIQLLLNKNATIAAIDNALDWIRQVTKKGDKVYFYFSGHGDVEQQTLWQLGYLLAHDTPFGKYRNNAVRLEDVNNLIKTISVADSLESKTIVILDACRSGKLAGSDTRGSSLTAEQLSKSVANEVRIMSCKPDQKSLESEKWGGGRGLFSYFLIKGLNGEADEDDKKVSLDELESYLKTQIKASLRNLPGYNQNPILEGEENFVLARVNPAFKKDSITSDQTLAAIPSLSSKGSDAAAEYTSQDSILQLEEEKFNFLFWSMENSGLAQKEELPRVLTKGNSDMYQFIFKTIHDLYSPESSKPNQLENTLEELKKASADVSFEKDYSRKLAGYIHNYGQQKLNLYLNGDAGELQKRTYYNQNEGEYERLSRYFEMAEKMIAKDHPLLKKIQIKKYYFAGIALRMKSLFDEKNKMYLIKEAIALQNKSSALDDKTPYVQNELGILYAQVKDFKKSERHYLQAIQLSPGWELPPSNLSALYNQQKNSKKAKIFAQTAIKMNPSNALAHINLGKAMMIDQDFLTALECFENARILDKQHYIPDYMMGELSLETENYAIAEEHFEQVTQKLNGLENLVMPFMQFPVEANITMSIFDELKRTDSLKTELNKKLKVNPRDTASLYELGILYKNEQESKKAEEMFIRVIQLNSNYKLVNYEYGSLAMQNQEYEKAEILFQKELSNHNSKHYDIQLQLAYIYETWRDFERAEIHYNLAIQYSEKKFEPYYLLYDFYFKQKKFQDAEKVLLNAYTLFPSESNNNLTSFYNALMHLFPNEGEWPYKAANQYLNHYDKQEVLRNIENDEHAIPDERTLNFQKYYSVDKNKLDQCLPLFQKAYDLESDPEIKRSIREKMATLVISVKQDMDHQSAQKYIDEVLKTDSTSVASLKNYLAIHDKLNRYHQALDYLNWLKKQSSISFSERLLLCRYTIYKGDYETAILMLQEARKISPFDEHKINGLLSMAYRLSLQKDKAEKLLLEIRNQSKVPGEISYTLARMKAKQNNKKSASQWLTSAFQNGFHYTQVLKYDPVWKDLWSEIEWVNFLKQNNITLPKTE